MPRRARMEQNLAEYISGAFSNMDISTESLRTLGIVGAVAAGQILLIWLVWVLFNKVSGAVKAGAGHKIKALTIRKNIVLSVKNIENIILFFLRIIKFFIIILQLVITLPILFSLHPATEGLASTIFGYILDPLRMVLHNAVMYVPNLITIIVFLLVTKYVIRGLRFFTTQIANGKMTLPGFYADWAWPTFNLLRVLLYAFRLAIIFPYLPGSDSRIFQGVSVFLGLIVSLGSSSAIGNLVAGMVITYMRPFKVGDLISIKEITGFVVEKSPFVIRLKNKKNESVTLPNLTVLNSDVVNYNTLSEHDGLILHAKFSMGYDVPWRDVYDILIRAAVKTPHIEATPKPFVLQTSLEDFYANYEINVYTKEINRVPLIYSLLYQHIQDEFKAAGISLYAPHYYKPTADPAKPRNS